MKTARLALALTGALVTVATTVALAHHFPVPNTPDGTVVLTHAPVAVSEMNASGQWKAWGNYFFASDGKRYRSAIFSYAGADRPVAIDYKTDAVAACRDNVMQTQFPVLWECESSENGWPCDLFYPQEYEAYYAASAFCSVYDETIYYLQH